jgi:cobalamin biosynthesis Mg chelatase CobN
MKCPNILCAGYIVRFEVSGALTDAQVDAVANAIRASSEVPTDRQATIVVEARTTTTNAGPRTEFVVTIRSDAPDSAGEVQTRTAAQNVAGATERPNSPLGQLGMQMGGASMEPTNASSTSSNTAAIVGAIVGVVGGFLVLAGIYMFCKAKKGRGLNSNQMHSSV